MAKHELRVSFAKAPQATLKQLFGAAKNAQPILDATNHFEGYAHEKEIFHYLNTDEDGDFVEIVGSDGKPTVAITMVNLRKQLSTMCDIGQLKRLGLRAALYALPTYEGPAVDEDDEDEDEAESE